jgi:hypothetical protein
VDGVGAVADDGELVIDRLISGELQLVLEKAIDKGGLSGGEGAEHRDQGPPRDPRGVGLVRVEHPEAIADAVERPEAPHHVEQYRVLVC